MDHHRQDATAIRNDEELLWDRIAERVDRLAQAWDRVLDSPSGEPALESFLDGLEPSERRTALCELIKIDLERRWEAGRQPKKIEFYLRRFPELLSGDGLPVHLIFEEFQIRLQAADRVDEDEVRRRFPQHASELIAMLGSVALPGSPTCTYSRLGPDRTSEEYVNEQQRLRAALGELNALQEGQTLDDFDLLLALGRGAFARVFLARQRSMERLVALKVTVDQSSEPQTLAQLDHPNIVQVFDQRKWGQAALRLLYMELVAGGTLQDVVRHIASAGTACRDGRHLLQVVDQKLAASGMAPPEGSHIRHTLGSSGWCQVVCQLGARIADGLAYAHRRGVLHRDIKPANVLLTSEGSPKLADFNISFNAARETEKPEDVFGGSLAYMSPEQLCACHPLLEGSPRLVREASDIYSLGVLLWELLTGARPFDDPRPSGGRAAAIQRMADRRRDLRPETLADRLPADCEASLRQVLLRCLHPDPQQRYRSAGDVAYALRLCLHPRCWTLLQEPVGLLGKSILRFPVTAAMIATILPNIVVAILNFMYNHATIISRLTADGRNAFMLVQGIVNATAFPIGIAVGIYVAKKRLRLLKAPPPSETLHPGGTAMLFLGLFVALLAVAMWCAAAVAYPIVIHWVMERGASPTLYVHFLASLTLCGLLAATYPFFLVTLLSVRWFVPAIIRRGISLGPSYRTFESLMSLMRQFLIMAALVPLLSILLTLIFWQEHRNYLITITVSGIGFAVLYYLLYRPMEEDIAALAELAPDHPGELGVGSPGRPR